MGVTPAAVVVVSRVVEVTTLVGGVWVWAAVRGVAFGDEVPVINTAAVTIANTPRMATAPTDNRLTVACRRSSSGEIDSCGRATTTEPVGSASTARGSPAPAVVS
jgi:hypothetical protein